jgi:hypothetical protein
MFFHRSRIHLASLADIMSCKPNHGPIPQPTPVPLPIAAVFIAVEGLAAALEQDEDSDADIIRLTVVRDLCATSLGGLIHCASDFGSRCPPKGQYPLGFRHSEHLPCSHGTSHVIFRAGLELVVASR